VLRKVEQAIDISNRSADLLAGEVKETTAYMWENKAEMDGMEKLSVRKSIAQMALSGEKVIERKKRLQKLLQSPYFGRIDFKEAASTRESPVYIGIHSFYDTVDNENLIHDWRAPVSAMFYDFELGEASYQAPSGEVKGEITLKRQYRIRNGRMEFMLETSLNVLDDILLQELSRNTSDRMRNIVATIQRDQNAIIRNEDARTLIIQGVAGSGKTSIALHRIAFLLYRYKESIRAEDILIVSPNKVFADYISNVRPDQGEEKMKETVMEDIANEILEG
jgi:DNA helicase-2/ATP-dependent DNA helicase PcrA